MRAHFEGGAADATDFDQTWHTMMDGMMSGWSRDDWDRCWDWTTGG